METASRLLLAKFEGARALFDKAPAAGVDAALTQALAGELSALEIRFALTTGHLYLLAVAGESGRIAAHAEYTRLLAAEDFAGEADRLVARGEAALRGAGVTLRESAADAGRGRRGRGRGRGRSADSPAGRPPANSPPAGRPPAGSPEGAGRGRGRGAAASAKPPRPPAAVCAEVQRILDVYPRGGEGRGEGPSPADGAAQHVDYEHCPACGSEMAVDTGRSELRCGECGAIRELVGTVFDDAQFYSQEGQKAKSGTFNPNRHFQFWWTHILAREPEEEIGDKDDADNLYGEKLLAALRTIIARDRKILRLLTVNDVRAMLEETGRTDLNKNVPLILKKLTGVGPPQVAETIAIRVENLFTKAIEVGERVRRPGRVNRNYYPYYIYKILAQLVREDAERRLREAGLAKGDVESFEDAEVRRVLFYIYIQSKDTVEADDDDWEQICLELPELVYVPTDRTKALRYHPQ